jgi:Mrp family chromosome partitioning ATPase
MARTTIPPPRWPPGKAARVHHRIVPRHAGVHSSQSGVSKNQKMILITSPGPAEGKTTVVQNLGIALAESGRKVLLVDADFRRPHLHRKFSLPNEWGLDRRAVRRYAR